ncbi:MAG: hypothetical protein VX682_00130, partial [Actinomycetota bacterium]|nr:hypothetical protein [Actinomycetota bacterium]
MNPSRADEPIATIDTVGLATVQDAGREGLTNVGVPRSGAWHRGRHRLAHALVHGTLDGPHPTLEILGSDMTLTIHQRQTLALVGPADLTVDGHRAPHAVAVDVSPATTVTIHHRGPGPAYVALSDWQPRTILKSAATDSFSHLGGPRGDGSPLSPGDVLMGSARTQDDRVGCFVRTEESAPSEIAVVAFDQEKAELLCAGAWQVDACARSGLRLSGPRIPASDPIPSMPVMPGAIQILDDGTVIVLGPDGGLTGGYPVIGVIASAHLDFMADLIVA